MNAPLDTAAVVREAVACAEALPDENQAADGAPGFTLGAPPPERDDDAANRRGTKEEASVALHHLVTTRDERPETMHAIAEKADRARLPHAIANLLDRNDTRRYNRAAAWDQHQAQAAQREAAMRRIRESMQRSQSRSLGRRSQDYGRDL